MHVKICAWHVYILHYITVRIIRKYELIYCKYIVLYSYIYIYTSTPIIHYEYNSYIIIYIYIYISNSQFGGRIIFRQPHGAPICFSSVWAPDVGPGIARIALFRSAGELCGVPPGSPKTLQPLVMTQNILSVSKQINPKFIDLIRKNNIDVHS